MDAVEELILSQKKRLEKSEQLATEAREMAEKAKARFKAGENDNKELKAIAKEIASATVLMEEAIEIRKECLEELKAFKI